ncbi:MAG: TerB family tellurite resistance protein [Chromatocurvus sp.]
MALTSFSRLTKLFREQEATADEEVYRELFVLVLSRATDADAYTHPAEIASVQAVIKEYLGEDVTSSDVRTAALSKLYESAPLHKYLAEVGPRLSRKQRSSIIQGLVQVLKADGNVSSREAEFFNMVTMALGLTAADAAGLVVK